jgi:hypothetical protein
MPYKNPAKRLEYAREWYAARRVKGIEYLGGKCAQCTATEDLELDHIDPALKFTHRIWSYSWPRIEAELAKCQLLCVPCHYKKTIAFISTAGGTWSTRKNHHKKGCGCNSCRNMRSAEASTAIKSSPQIKSREYAMARETLAQIRNEIWEESA